MKMGIIIAFLIILTVYGLANYYIGVKVYQFLLFIFPIINVKIYVGVFMFVAVSVLFTFLPVLSSVQRILANIGSYWMGIFIYLLMLFLIVDIVVLVASLIGIATNPLPGNISFYLNATIMLITVILVSYGSYNAKQIKHVSYEVYQTNEETTKSNPEIASVASPATAMNIILISDLHLGAANSEKQLERLVHKINKLEADMVCIAGDIFNDDYNAIQNPAKAIELFKSIKTTYGVYACLGNHDAGRTFNEMIDFLEQSDVKLLNDEYVVIDNKLVLLGRVDPSPIGGFMGLQRKDLTEILPSDILSNMNTKLPVVVIDHTPMRVEQYDGVVDLLIAGHTHKGQIFPFNFVTKRIFNTDHGYYQKDEQSPHVIVTSGVSTWGMPMRIGTNSEFATVIFYFR